MQGTNEWKKSLNLTRMILTAVKRSFYNIKTDWIELNWILRVEWNAMDTVVVWNCQLYFMFIVHCGVGVAIYSCCRCRCCCWCWMMMGRLAVAVSANITGQSKPFSHINFMLLLLDFYFDFSIPPQNSTLLHIYFHFITVKDFYYLFFFSLCCFFFVFYANFIQTNRTIYFLAGTPENYSERFFLFFSLFI